MLTKAEIPTSYRVAFPDFAPETMPEIPPGWFDRSWHNEPCPSFNTGNGHIVFVDYADRKDREIQEGDRFTVCACVDAYSHNGTLFSSDDWAAVLAFVDIRAMQQQAINDELANADRYLAINAWLKRRYTRNGKLMTHSRGMVPTRYTDLDIAFFRRYVLHHTGGDIVSKIYYLSLKPAPGQSAGLGFFEPDVIRLSKARQVGPKRKPKHPFACNRNKPWKKPLNGNAIRRKQP